MADAPILVIEDDPETARQLHQILGYLDLPHTLTSMATGWSQHFDAQHEPQLPSNTKYGAC